MPDEYKQLGKHIAAGMGFVSNFALWNEAGYFDASASSKPLLHLWSPGIEEQFYLVWPLALWLFAKMRRSALWLRTRSNRRLQMPSWRLRSRNRLDHALRHERSRGDHEKIKFPGRDSAAIAASLRDGTIQ